MRETATHIYFWGSFLSNFYRAPFKTTMYFEHGMEEFQFHSSEQYFMARKAQTFGDYRTLNQILAAPDAKSAKALGRKVKGFDADIWDKESDAIMYAACWHKFSQSPLVKYKLLDTYPKILVEASPFDKIWGSRPA